ncbi:MAG: GYF domain-containing protein [Bradymonadaceae bacterium]
MKFFCDGCNAKYSIADEKVRGKIVKVRCKRCGEIIEVTEHQDVATPEARASGDQQAEPGGPPNPPGRVGRESSVEWYYSVDGETYGPFDQRDLVEKCRRGEVSEQAYVWNNSFSDWEPAESVDPFQSALADGASQSGTNGKNTMGVTGKIESVEQAPDQDSSGGRAAAVNRGTVAGRMRPAAAGPRRAIGRGTKRAGRHREVDRTIATPRLGAAVVEIARVGATAMTAGAKGIARSVSTGSETN